VGILSRNETRKGGTGNSRWNEEKQFQLWEQVHVISVATLVYSQKEIF